MTYSTEEIDALIGRLLPQLVWDVITSPEITPNIENLAVPMDGTMTYVETIRKLMDEKSIEDPKLMEKYQEYIEFIHKIPYDDTPLYLHKYPSLCAWKLSGICPDNPPTRPLYNQSSDIRLETMPPGALPIYDIKERSIVYGALNDEDKAAEIWKTRSDRICVNMDPLSDGLLSNIKKMLQYPETKAPGRKTIIVINYNPYNNQYYYIGCINYEPPEQGVKICDDQGHKGHRVLKGWIEKMIEKVRGLFK